MTSIEGLHGAVIVTHSDEVVLERADGLADADGAVAVTARTRFQIASISKQFAAVAVLLLVEAGAVRLDDPVPRWLPEFPAPWRSVTLHHLLTHTAGVRHWDDTPGFDPSTAMTPGERLADFGRAPLLSEPGAIWRYSSPGYLLIGEIVARAGGRPYSQFVSERIVTPLRLTSITVGAAPAGAAVARGYRSGQPVPAWELSSMSGTGDIWSTVGDLARFTTAVHTGSVLTRHSVELLRTAHAPLPANDDGDDAWARADSYGYGHFIGRLGDHVAYFHPGDNPGYQSLIAWLPDHQTAAAVLVNDESDDIDQILKQILAAVTAG